MAVKFTTMIKMDECRQWKDYTLQQIREGEVQESNQIATFKMEIPKKETLEQNVKVIDAIRGTFAKQGDECDLDKEVNSKLVFEGWLGEAFCYDSLEDVYELKHQTEKAIEKVLEANSVEKCQIIYNITTLDF